MQVATVRCCVLANVSAPIVTAATFSTLEHIYAGLYEDDGSLNVC